MKNSLESTCWSLYIDESVDFSGADTLAALAGTTMPLVKNQWAREQAQCWIKYFRNDHGEEPR